MIQDDRPITRADKRAWQRRLSALSEAAEEAQENVLVGIYEARVRGLSFASIAGFVGGISPSTVAGKAARGEAILAERKGKRNA